jgi:hypothetical protein
MHRFLLCLAAVIVGIAAYAAFNLLAFEDRDQSVKIVRAIDAKLDELRRSGQSSITFTYLPGSTLGSGDRPIGDYEVRLTSRRGWDQVQISERNGQDHGTWQFPRVTLAAERMTVAKRRGEAVTFTLTRTGDAVALTSMR